MPVEDQPIILTPFGGVNYEDNPTRLPPTQVSVGANFLFEREQVISRPGLAVPPDTSFTFITGPVVFVDRVTNNAVEFSIFINSANQLWYIASGFGTGQITGTGASFGNHVFSNISSIIGLICIGNNPGGLITWDPTSLTNNYNIIAAAPYRYFAGHQGRAIATYNTTEPLLKGPRAFAYSKPGDITTWTSTDGSAGEIDIADLEDDITGIGVLHNIVVIPHRNGVHLGYPTGTLPLPYNIQSFSYAAGGFWQPSTIAFSDEYMIGVGEDNVFLFDLNTITPIGNPIRAELMNTINNGTLYRGFFTRFGFDLQPARWRYHLVPLGNSAATHFVYDLKDQTWGRHTYALPYNWAWNMPSSISIGLGSFGVAFVDNSNPPNADIWDVSTTPNQAQTVTRYVGIIEAIESDFLLEDIILHYQDNGSVTLTITTQCTEADTVITQSANVTIGGLNDGLWKRAHLARTGSNLRIAGNDFFITLTCPANSSITFDQMTVLLTPQGDFRG